MNNSLETILAPFVLFFLAGGGALAVAVIIAISFFRPNMDNPQYMKWGTVVVLSLGQAGCWKAMNNFNAAFGVHEGDNMILTFLVAVAIWLVYQVTLKFIASKKRGKNVIASNDHRERRN